MSGFFQKDTPLAEISIQSVMDEIKEEVAPLLKEGKVANYIPELGKVNPEQFGMVVTLLDGTTYETGQSRDFFSIQSISKVFALTKAFSKRGDSLWSKVGKEPSGNPFNSLVQLEHEEGKPRNPFINAGALVVADCIVSQCDNPLDEIMQFMQEISGDSNLTMDRSVYLSERNHGHRNAALAHFMKSYDNIESDVDDVLDFYFNHCSVRMNCIDLATSFLYLANHGTHPLTNKQYLTASQAKRINALMLTCGTYDAAGDFAFRVGLPGKSGVGGGIAAIIPGYMSIGVWSPGLDKYGNSLAGTKALELFTTKTGISIF